MITYPKIGASPSSTISGSEAKGIVHVNTEDDVTIAVVAIVYKAVSRRKLHRLSGRALVVAENLKAHVRVGSNKFLITATTGGPDANARR